MKRYSLLIASLLVLALLAGCDKEQEAPKAPPAPKATAKPPAKQIAPPSAEATVPAVEAGRYLYDLKGRRDPFVPVVGARIASFAENPLESFDLLQFQLKGLIVGLGEPKAVVRAPDGKSYILSKGMRIGKSNGVIREITPERIVVEEKYQDLTGATHTNIQEIKVPKREGV